MKNILTYDIVLIGGGIANFTLAHHLLDLGLKKGLRFSVAIIEKSKEFGSHQLSGGVSNPRVLKKIFPNYETENFPHEGICKKSFVNILGEKKAWNLPRIVMPKGMKKEGYLILSISEVVKWMYEKLKEKLSNAKNSQIKIDFFPGFTANKIIYDDKDKITAIQVHEDKIQAKVFCFNDKGFLSEDLITKFNLRKNPQIWSVGVKEIWQLTEDKNFEGLAWHSMGYPLLDGTFGGGFVYGMKNNKLALGLIAGLDSENPNLNTQQLLQALKEHSFIKEKIQGAKLLKYGAALLPEGGYYSLPEKFAFNNTFLLGDALGVLDVSEISGIDKSMETGYLAAETICSCMIKNDFSDKMLASYKEKVMQSFVGQDLFKGRYFRYAWTENKRILGKYLPTVTKEIDKSFVLWGMLKVALTNNPFRALYDGIRLFLLMAGLINIGELKYKKDSEHIRADFPSPLTPLLKREGNNLFSREDAVFYANPKYHEGNKHIDELNSNLCKECIEEYKKFNQKPPCVNDCTAEVHHLNNNNEHAMSLENCIQCRTCEIVCPKCNLKVKAAEQGSGPDFMGL